jgi:tetratricopeptide (TPR) repeat protein
MRILLPCLLVLALAILPACQMNERLSGTIMGGVGGGIIGGVAGGAVGAVVGTAAGAVAGYLVGDYIADGRERGRATVFTDARQYTDTAAGGAAVMGVKVDPRREAARAAYERGRQAKTATAAREAYETSMRLDPSRPEPYNALALNALYRGDRAEADSLLRLALEKDPTYYPAQYNLRRLASGTPILR